MSKMRQALSKQTGQFPQKSQNPETLENPFLRLEVAGGYRGLWGLHSLNTAWKLQAPVPDNSDSDNLNIISAQVPRTGRLSSKNKSIRAELEERRRNFKAPNVKRRLKSQSWSCTQGAGGGEVLVSLGPGFHNHSNGHWSQSRWELKPNLLQSSRPPRTVFSVNRQTRTLPRGLGFLSISAWAPGGTQKQ